MKRRIAKKPASWTSAKVYKQTRAAIVVWHGLRDLTDAAESRLITPTRADIAEVTGIERLNTISTALSTLHRANWILCEHEPVVEGGKQVATVMRITLIRGSSLSNKNRCIAKQQKLLQDSPTERGDQNSPPSPVPCEGSLAAQDKKPVPSSDTVAYEDEEYAQWLRDNPRTEPEPETDAV